MTYTLTINELQTTILTTKYKDFEVIDYNNYTLFRAKIKSSTLTIYKTGKVLLQGNDCTDVYLEICKALDIEDVTVKTEIKNDVSFSLGKTILGTDEVGTGDYFGPIVVTASYVTKDNIDFLLELGVKDSKKMSDTEIKKVVPQIIKKIPYHTFVLSNKQYNELYSSDMNMNKMKAILHNKVLSAFADKNKYPYDHIVVDQFENPGSYYNHLSDAKFKVYNITFLTKAEDQCLSVACSSLISRYIFLQEIDKISNSINMDIPKGASDLVDNVGKEIVSKYGNDKLKDIAKLNFKNTEKIMK